VAFLSAEVLSRADDDEELEDLRRSILLPLELKDLFTGRPPQRPGELVRRVLEALDQHPTCQPISRSATGEPRRRAFSCAGALGPVHV
jgi:hypothetical protein